MNFRKFRRTVQGVVESVGKTFTKPDDEWMPVLIMETPQGIGIVGTVFGGVEDKERWPLVVATLFTEHKPTRAAMIVSCWYRSVHNDDPGAEIAKARWEAFGLQDDPEKEEILMLEVGDSEKSEVWKASIVRHPDEPPTLDKWEEWKMDDFRGRMANVIGRAFELAKKV